MARITLEGGVNVRTFTPPLAASTQLLLVQPIFSSTDSQRALIILNSSIATSGCLVV
jgi:hypothetical protein